VTAAAYDRIKANPNEIAGLMSLASILRNKDRGDDARRLVNETLRAAERLPDHPRVADALSSLTPLLAQFGMRSEAEQVLERQTRIFLATKGAGSLALNAVSRGRIALLQQALDGAGVLAEYERMLARTEQATGVRSRESVYALREVAWAYPAVENWAAEERVLRKLLERTIRAFGRGSVDHTDLLEHMRNRARQFGVRMAI
jgi:hypothetical protein